jgi:hypothetical protein
VLGHSQFDCACLGGSLTGMLIPLIICIFMQFEANLQANQAMASYHLSFALLITGISMTLACQSMQPASQASVPGMREEKCSNVTCMRLVINPVRTKTDIVPHCFPTFSGFPDLHYIQFIEDRVSCQFSSRNELQYVQRVIRSTN